MAIRIVVFDNTTPLLDEMAKLSVSLALEVLSVSGAKLQKEARKSMRSKSHRWHKAIVNGKLRIQYTNNADNILGQRLNIKSKSNTPSMANMITSRLIEDRLTVVVGGGHKSFLPSIRRDGKFVGKGDRVFGVGLNTLSILHKLNFGDREFTHGSSHHKHAWGSAYERSVFKNVKFKGYHFMEEGYNNAKPAILDAMTSRYENLLHKAVNNAKIKTVKRGTA